MLRIAVRLFGMGAYEALDFGRVAEGLGVTRASVHRHFGKKSNLALEVLGSASAYYERLIEFLEPLVEESQVAAGTITESRSSQESASRAISAHFGIATMAMSLPAEREPESFSRRMRWWLSALSPRQEGTNPEETG